jgi:hypothetical protein
MRALFSIALMALVCGCSKTPNSKETMTIDNVAFSSHSCAPGWYASAIRGPDGVPVEAEAVRIQQSALAKGYFAVCGLLEREAGYRLFLAPSNDVVAVVRVFGVGKHAAEDDPEASARALQQVAAVQKRCALLPFFADAAGFKARLAEPVTDDLISFLEDTLTDAEPMMDDDDGSIATYVRKQKGIHLWWD